MSHLDEIRVRVGDQCAADRRWLLDLVDNLKETIGCQSIAFDALTEKHDCLIVILDQTRAEMGYWKALAGGDYLRAAQTKPSTFLEDVMEHDSSAQRESKP